MSQTEYRSSDTNDDALIAARSSSDRAAITSYLKLMGCYSRPELPDWYFFEPHEERPSLAVIMPEDRERWCVSSRLLSAPFSTIDEMELAIIYVTLHAEGAR